MRRVVADASYCGAWILPDEVSDEAADLLRQIEITRVELVIPSLWHYEMTNLLRSAQRHGRLTVTAAKRAQVLLGQVPVALCDTPSGPENKVILDLSFEFDLSAYDAAYVELASRLRIPLLTADRKLKRVATILQR